MSMMPLGGVRRIDRKPIHRSAWNRYSPKFAKNNALNGTKFIAYSSPLAKVAALVNKAALVSPTLMERRSLALTIGK